MRRIRFALGTLLIAVACAGIVAFVALWVVRYRGAQSAELEYERANAHHDAGAVTGLEVCQASQNWLTAELRVPFARPVDAWAAHVYRVACALSAEEMIDTVGLFAEGGREQHLRLIERIREDFYLPALDELRQQRGSTYADSVERAMQDDERIIPVPSISLRPNPR